MRIHRAAWVLPIASPPVRDGWVAIDDRHIAGVGSGEAPSHAPAESPGGWRRTSWAIMPGLVNAHTHLELSHLRNRVPPGESFDAWVRALVAERRSFTDPSAEEIVGAARLAIAEARAAGTAVIGDISNSLVSVPLLREAAMAAHVFHEVLGFNAPEPAALVAAARERLRACDVAGDGVRVSLAPHAPYSVSPAMFEAIARELASSGARSSVHLGESPEEVEFLRTGGGPIRAALDAFGVWNPHWQVPGCGPVEYMQRFGLLSDRLLAVHGVQLSEIELSRLAAADATLVTCPRSNRWTGVGDPPASRFYASGVRVAVGTDSLASVADLNVFSELAAIRRLAPDVPARTLLDSATRAGAEALGFEDAFGTIERGKLAELIAVRVPAGVADVEEYLVSGIQPSDIRWLRAPGPANP